MTADDVDTFCTVFVHGAADRKDLASAVRDIIGGVVDDWCTVAVDGVEAQARESDEFSATAATEFPVGFYSFPFLLEVEFADGTAGQTAVETVSRILRGLWDRGWAAVAVTEYADLLPHEGGLSEQLPWPRG